MAEPMGSDSRREQRSAAIALAATRVASRTSLTATLETLAEAVCDSGGVAGVQIITLNDSAERFHVVGAAGFPRTVDFFERLLDCRQRGATFEMFRAFDERHPVVVPHRYEALLGDPAWEPLHDFLRSPRWDTFASIPMIGRDSAIGVVNIFLEDGVQPDDEELAFFQTMAEQAALAIEFASLFERERDVVRHEERQRLARDLHDSVVQQVFSISMQARTLGLLARNEPSPTPHELAAMADDIAEVANEALQDLRGMVDDLRPGAPSDVSLGDALDNLARTTTSRTALTVTTRLHDPDDTIRGLPRDLAEDAYRILAEAVHNSVKHSGATHVTVEVEVMADVPRTLSATVSDDGSGGVMGWAGGAPGRGFGLIAMRERAARWAGNLSVEQAVPHGTIVRMQMPLPVPSVAEDARWTMFR